MFDIILHSKDSQTHAMGLQLVPTLPKNAAALFTFTPEQHVSFWNRGVSYPIDLLFFNSEGNLFQKESLEAEERSHVFSQVPAKWVLEVNKGEGENVQIGRHIQTLVDKELQKE